MPKSKILSFLLIILAAATFCLCAITLYLVFKNKSNFWDSSTNQKVLSSQPADQKVTPTKPDKKDKPNKKPEPKSPSLHLENKLIKNINSNKYMFQTMSKDKPSGSDYLMHFGDYDTETGKYGNDFEDDKAVLAKYITDETIDFWFDEPTGTLILVNTEGGWTSNNKNPIKVSIYNFDINNYDLISHKDIYENKLDSAKDYAPYIFGYFPIEKLILFTNSTEVSCFTKGTVLKMSGTGVVSPISDYTNGCKYDFDRFGGLVGNKIAFATQTKNYLSAGTTSSGHISQMYTIDPLTMRKQIVGNFTAKQNLDLIFVHVYKDGKTSDENAMLMGEGYYLYNLKTRALDKFDDIKSLVLQY